MKDGGFGIKRTGTGSELRLVGSRVCDTRAEQASCCLRLRVDEVQAAACRHPARN
jgi:hypothetical protein